MKKRPLSIQMIQMYGLALFYFTANAVLTIIIPLQANEYGIREAEIGMIMGMYMFVCMVLRPWAGQLISKYSVATTMKYLLIAHAITLLIYAAFGIDSLYIVRILQGVVTAFFSMAMQIGVMETLRDEDRGQGMAMYSLSTVMPGLYGPILAMLLWTQNDVTWLLIVIVLLALLPLVFFVKSPLPRRRDESVKFTFKEMKEGVKLASSHKGLIVSVSVMIMGASIFGALTTFVPLSFVATGIGDVGFYLFIQAIVVVGSRFLFRKYIPSDGAWHPGFIALVLCCSVIGTTMLSFMSTLGLWLYVSAMFNGVAIAMLYPTLTTYISFALPESHKQILLGLFLASYDLGFSLGGMLMGVIAQLVSYPVMFASCSLIGLIAILCNYLANVTTQQSILASRGEKG